MDQTTQMDLRDAYAAEHHSQTPGSIVAKAVATGNRRAGMMGDLGAVETAERDILNYPLFISGYPEVPGAISNDPVSTDVNICGAKEKDVDVPVKLQDGEESMAHVRVAAVEDAAAEQAAKSIAAQSAAAQSAAALHPAHNVQ